MAELQQPTVDTGSILSQLGLTSDQVLQQPTVQATLTNTNDSDALGIFSKQDELAGVAGYQTAYKTAQERRMAGEGLANQEQLTIEGRRKRLGVLRGEQQQAAQLAQADINTLLQGEQLAQSALSSAQQTSLQKANILYNEYQTKNNLLLQYPGLDINPLKDSFEDISEEIGKYTEKQKYIEVLREYGKNTKGSRGLLRKRYRSLLKNLEEEEEAEAEKLERRADEKWELEKRNIESLIDNRGGGGRDEDAKEHRERISMQNDIVASIGQDEFDIKSEADIAGLTGDLISLYPAISPEEIQATVRERTAVPDIVADETLGSDFDFGRPRGIGTFSPFVNFGGRNDLPRA